MIQSAMTRSQMYLMLAVVVPALALAANRVANAMLRPEGPTYEVSLVAFGAPFLLGFPVFAGLALATARPASKLANSLRTIAGKLLGIASALLGVAGVEAVVRSAEPLDFVLALLLPLGLALLFGSPRRWLARRSLRSVRSGISRTALARGALIAGAGPAMVFAVSVTAGSVSEETGLFMLFPVISVVCGLWAMLGRDTLRPTPPVVWALGIGNSAALGALHGTIFLSAWYLLSAAGESRLDIAFWIAMLTFLAPALVNWEANRRARRRGQGPVLLVPQAVLPVYDWRPLAAGEARREWDRLGAVRPAGELSGGWSCRYNSAVKLDYRDDKRNALTLIATRALGVPHIEWLRGLAVARLQDPSRGSRKRWWRLRLGLVEPACRWEEIPYGGDGFKIQDPVDSGASGRSRAWGCADCGATRVIAADAEDRDVLFVAFDPSTQPEPLWFAGLFLMFGQAPPIAA